MLENEDHLLENHKRMKGVSLNTVSKVAEDCYKNDLFELSHELFKGEKIDFNLLSTAVRFKNTKARTVVNCNKFTRGVSFKSSIKRNVVDK